MNRGTPEESNQMLESLIPLVKEIDAVDIVIAVPFTVLTSSEKILKGTSSRLTVFLPVLFLACGMVFIWWRATSTMREATEMKIQKTELG